MCTQKSALTRTSWNVVLRIPGALPTTHGVEWPGIAWYWPVASVLQYQGTSLLNKLLHTDKLSTAWLNSWTQLYSLECLLQHTHGLYRGPIILYYHKINVCWYALEYRDCTGLELLWWAPSGSLEGGILYMYTHRIDVHVNSLLNCVCAYVFYLYSIRNQ